MKNRETWLLQAMQYARPLFEEAGAPLPEEVRVSCGLPSVGAFASKRRIGEAWASTASKDKHCEVFISPTIDDPVLILGVLLHELVHCAVGVKCGHKGKFPIIAGKIGLLGPWTSTTAGESLNARLTKWAERLGEYPHGKLEKMDNGRKKQATRLVKCWCDECGYTVRSTLKWLLLAAPTCPDEECPNYGVPFKLGIEGTDGDEGGFAGSAKVRKL